MRKQHWPKRDPIKNYFPLPNEIFSLGLSAGAIQQETLEYTAATARRGWGWPSNSSAPT